MRITERRLRSIINNVISEMNHIMPAIELPASMPMHSMGHDMSSFMNKALACCRMPAAKLFDMCARICEKNPDQSSHCAELCACVCCGDEQNKIEVCCRCLGEICKCSDCVEICYKYCDC